MKFGVHPVYAAGASTSTGAATTEKHGKLRKIKKMIELR